MMQNDRKRIVILTDWFLPAFKAGGPIQSCANIAFALMEHYQVFIIAGDTDAGDSHPYINTVNEWMVFKDSDIKVYYVSGTTTNFNNLKKLIQSVEPEFIYLNHLFSIQFVLYPLLMGWLNQVKCKIVLCPRGALFPSALHYKNTYLKKKLVLSGLRYLGVMKNVRFHATNSGEELTIQKFFPGSSITVINNLLQSTELKFTSVEKKQSELKVIFIARVVPIKNLLFVLRLIKKCDFSINFTIIGPIEDQVYWQECQSVIDTLPKHINVAYLGAKATSELEYFLSASHLFILPTKGENFGHSIAEALRAGRPVLISDKTPWRNLAEKEIGWDLPIDYDKPFLDALHTAAAWSQVEFDKRCLNALIFATAFSEQNSEIEKYKTLFS
jgi:glycosyltransferase involved in cell wall biosynthesis